jgi:hypothetical protein
MPGRVEINENGPNTTISLNGDNGDITAGGNGQGGDLIILDAAGQEVVRLTVTQNSKGHAVAGLRFENGLQLENDNHACILFVTTGLQMFDAFGKPALLLQASHVEPKVTIGGNGRKAVLEVLDHTDEPVFRVRGSEVRGGSFSSLGESGSAMLNSIGLRVVKNGKQVSELEGEDLKLGNSETPGMLLIRTSQDEAIVAGGEKAQIVIGRGGKMSTLQLNPSDLFLAGSNGIVFRVLPSGEVTIGGSGSNGNLSIEDERGRERVNVSSGLQSITTKDATGKIVMQVSVNGDLRLGGGDADGDVFLMNRDGGLRIHLGASDGTIVINDRSGNRAFDANANGRLVLRGSESHSALSLKPVDGKTGAVVTSNGEMTLGGNSSDGDLRIKRSNGKQTARLSSSGDLFLGGGGVNGDIRMYPSSGTNGSSDEWSISLNSNEGDIFLKNADCAEEFEMAEHAEPGAVMVIDEEGQLRQCYQAYDKTVAGVISGAGNFKPGIVLDKQLSSQQRKPVALVGKVFCKVDASYAAIRVGDLLTTSPTAGHAMKAIDPLKAFGSVIGKALKPLQEGNGLIPILIALQ